MAEKKSPKKSEKRKSLRGTLEPGHCVAIALRDRSLCPLPVPVGRIEAVDDHGIRLTLLDWALGEFVSDGLFVAWPLVGAVLVADPATHDIKLWADKAASWQKHAKTWRGPPPLPAENGKPGGPEAL